jgi:hypothetical protein
MSKDLDQVLAQLKSAPVDRDLRNLEPQVWDRIDARQKGVFAELPLILPASGGLMAVPLMSRIGAMTLAVAIGLSVGILAASSGTSASGFEVFSTQAPFAPSGLLG